MFRDSKSLEISCYVIGAGAFGVFARWMQLQLAYNEEQLPDKSAWNVIVVLLIIAAAAVFFNFVKKMRDEGKYLPESFFEAFKNEGKLYAFCRWFIGLVMIAGSILLLATCELDKDAAFLRVLSVFGVLTGVAFTLMMTAANKPHVVGKSSLAFLGFVPILFFAVWLVTAYKQNSINPVEWDYLVEILAVCVSMCAFFRIAGYAYGTPNEYRTMAMCMLGAMTCIMNLPDGRYLGQQVMFIAAAMMMIMINWVMVANLKQKEKKNIYSDVYEDEGFERI